MPFFAAFALLPRSLRQMRAPQHCRLGPFYRNRSKRTRIFRHHRNATNNQSANNFRKFTMIKSPAPQDFASRGDLIGPAAAHPIFVTADNANTYSSINLWSSHE
jgi:hypothetical protein